MRRVILQGLLAHKLRLALTALAIVLGVTFISGTFVLTDTLHNTFTTLFGHVYQNVDFEIRGKAAFSTNNGDDGRGPQTNPPVDRHHGATHSRRGLRRRDRQRVRAIRRPRREGDQQRGSPDSGFFI